MKPPEGVQFRNMTLENIDRDNRVITFALSSEQPARQRYGIEVLEHSERAIDWSATRDQSLAIVWDHGQDPTMGTRPHGRARNLRLDPDRRTRGELHFRAGDVWDMVDDGTVTDVSLGYEILDYEERSDVDVYVTKWRPREVSLTAVPKDFTVGANRSVERPMTETVTTPPVDENALIEKGRKAELARRSRIEELSKLHPNCGELKTRALDQGLTPDAFLDSLVQLQETPSDVKPLSVQPGQDIDVRAGIADALMYRSALYEYMPESRDLPERKALKQRMEGNEFRGFTISDIARYALTQQGYRTEGVTNRDLVLTAMGHPEAPPLQRRAVDGPHNTLTTDLPLLLADQINKAILLGWELADETWNMWVQTSSAADFKQGSRVHTSNLSRLGLTAENDEYPLTTIHDEAEPFQCKKYGRRISVSIEALTNDDLSDLTRLPTKLGRAASATVGDTVYGVLTGNPNMSDGNPLFDTINHKNTGTPSAPDPASVSEMRVGMGLQTDNQQPTENTLNIKLRYLLTPLTQEDAARIVVESITNPIDHQSAGIINPQFTRNFLVVADPRLDLDNPLTWYGAATMDTVEVIWVNGQSSPMVDSQPNFRRDGIEYRGRLFWDAIPTDYRTLYRNAGA